MGKISVAGPGCLFWNRDLIFFIPDPGSKRYRIPDSDFVSIPDPDFFFIPDADSESKDQKSTRSLVPDPDPQHWAKSCIVIVSFVKEKKIGRVLND
jgi:hypothetical protein